MNWTPEPPHVRRPDSHHSRIAWVLWALGALLITAWIAAMALGAKMSGFTNLLLAAFGAVMLLCVLMGFRNVAYLEPMRIARRRILRIRIWRAGTRGKGLEEEPPA